MEFGSTFVYLGNSEEDEEEVVVSSVSGVVLSDSDDDDNNDDGEVCLLDILDTAGQEEYSTQRDMYVHSSDGFVIIYSITDRNSFNQAESIFNWLKRIKAVNPLAVLVANKQDLSSEAVVTSQEGIDLASNLGIPIFETSAKAGTGVVEALTGLVRIIPRTSTDYKIVMLGAGAVGKSSVTLRFVSDKFVETYDPTIEDSYRKMIRIQGLKLLSKEERTNLKKARKKAGRNTAQISASRSSPTSSISAHRRDASGRFERMFSPTNSRTRSTTSEAQIEEPKRGDGKKIKAKKIDGNVVLIPLQILENAPQLVTGDPIKCASCLAVLTGTATLETKGDKKEWTCEFCSHKNCDLEISENEIPQGDSFDFMLSPATKSVTDNTAAESDLEKKKEASEGVTVYCMDISGSMSQLCHVPESHVAWREERTHGLESVSRVTRLDCIKKAIQRLTEQLKLDHPRKQVLLTVFGSEVFVKGGGSTEGLPQFTGLESKSFEVLLELGRKLSTDYPLKTIEESYQSIDNAVNVLQTTGSTALGPALSICIGCVSEKPGSEIVLCTDGQPNVGIGSMGRPHDFSEVYRMIGTYARSKNITINILAVGESSSQLQSVSAAAEISGGLTSRLNPVEMLRQLRLISQNEIIAMAVSVRFYLHPDFVFDEIDFGDNLSQLEKEVGNVRKETTLSFRFKQRDPKKKLKLSAVPFQVQIVYTLNDGMTCLRVLTKSVQTTCRRKEMEENIKVSVLGVTTMKATAKMAQSNRPTEAQHLLKNAKRLFKRGIRFDGQMEERLAFKNEVAGWDDMLTYQHKDFLSKEINDTLYSAIQKTSQTANAQRFTTATKKMEIHTKCKPSTEASKAYYEYKDNF